MQLPPFLRIALTAMLMATLSGAGLAGPANGTTPEDAKLQMLGTAAKEAQDKCFKEIYRDVNAYAQCIRNLVGAKKPGSLEALGVSYFGFVGALSYMRQSQAGTDQVAWEFLQSAAAMQKTLRIDDAALCSTVAGDCTVRIAQTRALQAHPPERTAMRMQCIAQVCRLVPVQ